MASGVRRGVGKYNVMIIRDIGLFEYNLMSTANTRMSGKLLDWLSDVKFVAKKSIGIRLFMILLRISISLLLKLPSLFKYQLNRSY